MVMAARVLKRPNLAIALIALPLSIAAVAEDQASETLVHVKLADTADTPGETLSGRILLTAADGGILVEQRNGTLHNLTPEQFQQLRDTGRPFTWFDSNELAKDLTTQMGAVFFIRQTRHFVICSSASNLFTIHCAELLEKVYGDFFEFFQEVDTPVRQPEYPLPVVIFRGVSQLREHARHQHPEISFDEVPGYYSSRFNHIYISDIGDTARTRGGLIRLLKTMPRHTETIVHEAVHQLGHNSGLHARFADNPLWFTEGLALYFESSSRSGRLLWSGPGRPNAFHLNQLRATGKLARLPVSLTTLISDNSLFQDPETAADAYASSWALVHGLIRRDRDAFLRIARTMQQRSPLREFPPEDEIRDVQTALGRSLTEFEDDVVAALKPLRFRRP